MKKVRAGIIATTSTVVTLAFLPQVNAQTKGEVTIESYSCRDLLREAGGERDIAVAFMHGYILGRSGTQKFDVENLRKQSAVFLERCLDDPQAKALDTLLKSAAGTPAPGRDAPRSP